MQNLFLVLLVPSDCHHQQLSLTQTRVEKRLLRNARTLVSIQGLLALLVLQPLAAGFQVNLSLHTALVYLR